MTTVVYYSSTDAGAPTLNNAAGSMIGLLDAILVNGYGTKPVTSISVSSGVATVVCSAHGFTDSSVQEIVGATPALLNGRKLITVSGANGFTFAAPGVPDGSATGTITAKRPGLGWEKEFSSGATKAVYKRTDPAATAMRLRVADTGAGTWDTALDAEVTMYEAMTDVDTGTAPAPAAHGQQWPKGLGNATAARWIAVGDSRTLYLFTSSDSSGNQWSSGGTLTPCMFGDVASYRAADAYGCALSGPYTHGATVAGICTGFPLGGAPSVNGSVNLARRASAVGGLTPFAVVGSNNTGASGVGLGTATMPKYPSPVDNGAVLSFPLRLAESNSSFNHPIRGEFRGLAEPLFDCTSLPALTVFSDVLGSDRKWLIAPGCHQSPTDKAFVMIDITGPWQA